MLCRRQGPHHDAQRSMRATLSGGYLLMNGVAGVVIDELVVIERQVWLKLRLVEIHIIVCIFEVLDGIKYIVKRPEHGVLFGVSKAEGNQVGGDAVTALPQLPASVGISCAFILHIVIEHLTDRIDIRLRQTIHIQRSCLGNGGYEVCFVELRPMALVVYLIVNHLNGVPETHIFNAVLHRMLTSFLAVADDTHPLVFIHRDIHVAVLGNELALEPSARFVLLEKEYHIESWEVGPQMMISSPHASVSNVPSIWHFT